MHTTYYAMEQNVFYFVLQFPRYEAYVPSMFLWLQITKWLHGLWMGYL
jgi:hypothetical protein